MQTAVEPPPCPQGFELAVWNMVDRHMWVSLPKAERDAHTVTFRNTEVSSMDRETLHTYYAFKHFRHYKVQAERKQRAKHKRTMEQEQKRERVEEEVNQLDKRIKVLAL